MLEVSDFLFYILALGAAISAAGVIFSRNPIFSAFFLALTMVSVAGIFYTLGAHFIAGVQLIVYAGAVMVLFVMVLMLFDLKHEMKTFSKGMVSGVVKLLSLALILGLIAGASWITAETLFAPVPAADAGKSVDTTKALSELLFTKYLFGFEAIGVLLLIIAVGAVTLSRISGGTHADS